MAQKTIKSSASLNTLSPTPSPEIKRARENTNFTGRGDSATLLIQGIIKNGSQYISLRYSKDLQTKTCVVGRFAGGWHLLHHNLAQEVKMNHSNQSRPTTNGPSKQRHILGAISPGITALIGPIGAMLVGMLAGCGGGSEPLIQTAQVGPLAVQVGSASGDAVLDNRRQSLVVHHKEGLSVTLDVPPNAIQNGRFSGRLVSGGETVWRLQMVPTASDGVETNCMVDTQIILNDDADSGEFELDLPRLLAQAGCTNTSALRAGARISLSPANQAQPTDLMVQAAGQRKAGGQ